MAGYQPGVCNIGKTEIRKRYAFAVAGFIVAAILAYVFITYKLPHWTLLITFIPIAMAFEGFYQGYFHFCAGNAAKGIYDFTGSGGKEEKVTDPVAHKKDMGKAMQIHIYTIISTIVLVAIIFLVL